MTELIYDVLYLVPLCLSLLLMVGRFVGVQEMGAAHYAFAIAGAGVVSLIQHVRLRGKITIVGIVSIAAVGGIFLLPKEERLLFLANQKWMMWLMLGFVGIGFLQKAMKRYEQVRILFAIGICILLGWTMATKAQIQRFGIVMLLFILLLIVIEEVQRHWEKSGSINVVSHLVYVAPFLLIGLLFMSFVPVSEKPYDWQFAKNIYERAKEQIVMMAQNWSGGLGINYEEMQIGFANQGGLAGNLGFSSRDVLQVEGRNKNAPLYLAGKIYDSFDGRQWIKTDMSEQDDRMLDTLETLAAVEASGAEFPEDFYRATTIHVTYRDMKSHFMLAPLKTVTETDELVQSGISDRGGELLFEKRKGYNSTYSVKYYLLNQGNEVWEQLMVSGAAATPESWNAALNKAGVKAEVKTNANAGVNANASAGTGTSYNDLIVHRAHIYETYAKAPALSEQIKETLHEKTDGLQTNYEKLSTIEAWLLEYSYSIQPGTLPETVDTQSDYMDYFLLQSKEGYCSHYATAFVLLARELGIPARYVQGFRLPVKTKAEDPMVVVSDMAHAWPEAYIEGIGWIPFEPTPGFKRLYGWKTRSDKQLEKEKADAAASLIMMQMQEMDSDESEIEDAMEEQDVEAEKAVFWKNPFANMIMIVVCASILFLLFIGALDLLLQTYRFRRMKDETQFRILCKRNLLLIKMLGYERETQETLEEFRISLQEKLPSNALAFVEQYENVLYGMMPVSKEMLSQALSSNEELLGLLKVTKKIWYPIYYFRSISTASKDSKSLIS